MRGITLHIASFLSVKDFGSLVGIEIKEKTNGKH
jgi:hypothetical protein